MSFDNVDLVAVGGFRGDEAEVGVGRSRGRGTGGRGRGTGGRGRGAGGRARGSLAGFSLKVPAFGARGHGGMRRKAQLRGKSRGLEGGDRRCRAGGKS
ncbi:uncharacterized protein LOC131153880 [Malania oleifera]|uniref:uncharacterized protein LOC131153880 n=1 Tax=Malania oleifera TaxID=397392 RepID=UPI0025ADA64C|nr:uncharacterized protein LOC131153880 [Malania oleifera]